MDRHSDINPTVRTTLTVSRIHCTPHAHLQIATLRHLGKHKHIVSLHDVLYAPNETIMLTDLVQGGELFDYIVDMGSVSEQDASRLLRDACRALAYMHARGIWCVSICIGRVMRHALCVAVAWS